MSAAVAPPAPPAVAAGAGAEAGAPGAAAPADAAMPRLVELESHPKAFKMQVPAGGVLTFEDGAMLVLPSSWGDEARASMCLTFCRCGVVVRCPVIAPDGTAAGFAALKVQDKAALHDQGDSGELEVAAMAATTPRGLLLPSRPCPGLPRWDALEDERNVYIVTEWADAGSLRSWALQVVDGLLASGQVGLWFSEYVPRVIWQLCQALAYMHDKGVVHLDLDPRNLVVFTDGKGGYDTTLIDFGSARRVGSLTGRRSLVGDTGVKFKLRFTSPQEYAYYRTASRYSGPAADVFHLGGILWWLMSLPVAVANGEADDDRTLDQEGFWRYNLMQHFAGEHAEQHAARVREAAEARALWEAECFEAAQRGLPQPPQPSFAPAPCRGECLMCRWNFVVPEEWQYFLIHMLHDKTENRPTAAQLFTHLDAMVRRMIAARAAAAEAAARHAAETVAEAVAEAGIAVGDGSDDGKVSGEPSAGAVLESSPIHEEIEYDGDVLP